MSEPKRVQLSRRKGWKMPPNTVSVARPTRWGNPFRVGVHGDAAECVRKFEAHLLPYRHGGSMDSFLLSDANMRAVQNDLRGLDLACWCKLDEPCHADLLLKVANGGAKVRADRRAKRA